jgi:DNA repair protein RadC
MRYLKVNDKRIKKQPVMSPSDVVPIFNALIRPEHRHKEHFMVICLDARNVPISAEVVSIGTLNACLVHPRETFRTAVLKCAASLIASHNHPSGGLEPSSADIELSKRLKHAGKILGIEVCDQLIINGEKWNRI